MTILTKSFSSKIPEGDDKPRSVCDTCGFIDYVNPKIVAGSVVRYDDKFLLCRRAIEPRRGYWTLPAGFMEQGETVEEAARSRGARRSLRGYRNRCDAGDVFSAAHLSGANHVRRPSECAAI